MIAHESAAKKFRLAAFLFFGLLTLTLRAQQEGGGGSFGSVSGSFQIDTQVYFEDSVIGTPLVDEVARTNGYGQITYSVGDLTAGMRYEAYLPKPLLGIDGAYEGSGIVNRYATFNRDRFSVTVGHFYEQFGMGMILRAWWEPLLGWDTAIDGIRATFEPVKGLRFKGLYGRQRIFYELGRGSVRGGDVEVDMASLLDTLWRSRTNVTFGASYVSKFEAGKTVPRGGYVYNVPENIGAASARLTVQRGGFSLRGEYAHKANDPNANNGYIYRPGQALYVAAGYTQKGFGANLEVKRLDNMDFRSDRTATGQNLVINFLPPIARQHSLRLPTLYIYATQPNGEMGAQADVFFRLPKESLLGGRYGTTVSLNYSRIHDLDTMPRVNEEGYRSEFFAAGKRVFYSDFNIEIQRKISPKLKTQFMYIHMTYDRDKILGLEGYGRIGVNAVMAEGTYQLTKKYSIRVEGQWMGAEQIDPHTNSDFGDWGMLLVELNASPHWFISVGDEYNYGNAKPEKRAHYYSAMTGYIFGSSRISLSYGRVREGLNCAGGICRPVPAMNGFMLSVQSTF